MLKPTGFWSYHRPDGTRSHGWLSQLHSELVAELEGRIGTSRRVSVFRDEETLRFGVAWESEIDSAIDDASFLVAIMTPGFLQSEWCCREVERFRRREAATGATNLIFPIHYIDVDDFRHRRQQECHDATVLDLMYARQIADFRQLRFESLDSKDVRARLNRLADAIYAALFNVVALTTQSVPTAVDHVVVAPAAPAPTPPSPGSVVPDGIDFAGDGADPAWQFRHGRAGSQERAREDRRYRCEATA